VVPGVEGLVHISELAEHHVENPSEVVQPGNEVWVRVLEIDEARRRISLSVKRAEPASGPLRDLMPPELTGQVPAAPEEVPDLDVSEEVFPAPPPEEAPADEAPEEPPAEEPAAEEPPAEEPAAEEPAAEEPPAEEPTPPESDGT
jgi:small subunit ribosomal protein S1